MPGIMRGLITTTLLLFLALPAQAQEAITEIRTVSPAWDTFTNEDGTGLYFDILNELFTGLYGIKVRHDFVPSLRATYLVAQNEADIMTCKARVDKPLVMAKYPMYENAYYVFFNKQNIGQWKGRESLSGRSVVWRISYYDERYIPKDMVTKEVKDGVSALGMVVLGRMDFYLDDKTLINESISKSKLQYNKDDFRIEPVGFRSYHPVFNRSERGQQLMALYDKGMETLQAKGILERLLKKWGHPVLHLENY